MEKGGEVLGLEFSPEFQREVVSICFSNVGILQTLIVKTLDELGVVQQRAHLRVDKKSALESAALSYTGQLEPLYHAFVERVSGGIRVRKDSTGIYAHAMAVIFEASDNLLISGISVDYIFARAVARQPRIQKGNLKSVLAKFEELQVDSEGRGLVLSFNPATEQISVVDRQLLLYRKFCTVKWPWEDLIAELGRGDQTEMDYPDPDLVT